MNSEVRKGLSIERLTSYVRAAGGDEDLSAALYAWNIRASGALFEVLSGMEIILRNSVHQRFTEKYAARGIWFDAISLDTKAAEVLRVARERSRNNSRVSEQPGKVVAELSFGFWRYLFSRRYQATVWPILQPIFRNQDGTRPPRVAVDRIVEAIHTLRNRIAHHEPIFRRNLLRDHQDILQLVGWLNPSAANWLSELSRVSRVLADKPAGIIQAPVT